jgi:hypothetical protein
MAWVPNRDPPMESIRISYKIHENFGEQSNGGKKLRRDEKNNTRSNTHQEKGKLNE